MSPELIKAAADYSANPSFETARRFHALVNIHKGMSPHEALEDAEFRAMIVAYLGQDRSEEWKAKCARSVERTMRQLTGDPGECPSTIPYEG